MSTSNTVCETAQISLGTPELNKNRTTKRKRTKTVRMTSGKHETSLELIREQEDEVDHKLSTVQSELQGRRSPRRHLPRQIEMHDSDSDEENDDDNVKLTLDCKPLANKKKKRTVRTLAMRKKASEDYDGDYEDEVATPCSDIDPTIHSNQKAVLVEVHHPLNIKLGTSRDVNSVSSNEGSNDRVKLLSEVSPVTPSGNNHSVPSLHQYTLLDRSPRRHRSEGALRQNKFTFPDLHSPTNESTV